MNLEQAIAAAGMTPPHSIVEGRWMRFPGIGKGKSNRAGWCRVITPTLAIFGDWSTGLSEVWRDDAHVDDERSRRFLEEARRRERKFAADQLAKQETVAVEAERIVKAAVPSLHPYLARKGFPTLQWLCYEGKVVVPVRDAHKYGRVISVQLIAEDGEKRFLTGGRTRNGVYRFGSRPDRARKLVLCEGYATGLSIYEALQRLPGPHTVVVCFSARNLEIVAEAVSRDAVVCADNDESRTGETTAQRTGLRWTMPPDTGTDWNDVHVKQGLHAVTEALRDCFAR